MENVNKFLKRLFDIFASLIALVIVSPILLIIAIAIKLDSKGPVLFKQTRLGLNGQPFIMYKFRTMVENAEKMGLGIFNFKDDPRVTKVGYFLRKFSLDELPQLLNIIKGEMSIVGPRPPVTYELGNYEDFDNTLRQRFTMKPGLTGYAQISGRNELSWDEKIKYDLQYIFDFKKYGILIDFKVILITLLKVLKSEGMYEIPEKAKKDMERIKKTGR
jgi:lipopolysaccharide/colanic/teichoic acid biosynthesis glycosyltransferase